MKLQYELHLEDVIQYYLHMSHKSSQFKDIVKKKQIRLFVFLILGTIVSSIIWPVSNILLYLALSAVISLLAAYSYSFFIFYRIERRLRKFHSRGKEGSLYGKKTVEIGCQGVSNQIDETEGVKYKWETIKEVYITSLYAYIHVNELTAIVIPRRVFSDRHAWEEFKSMLTSYHQLGGSGK